MRVIAGVAKHLLLKTLKGDKIRPTTDRIKETFFNIINPHIYDCNFLDLFAGSGSIGIEALSRGARHTTFIEKNRLAVNCINENLVHTKLQDKATVVCSDVVSGLKSHRINYSFDIIFMDPPYYENLYISTLDIIKKRQLLEKDGMIVLECDLKNINISEFKNLGYEIIRIKNYKNIAHIFLKGA